ncbi:MAG: SPOCS domain-containing protein [Brotaphodocola sp.]
MLELIKRNIHMNRWKNQISTQVTLDDDFIVPDTMSDIVQIILDAGNISLEPVKVQSERVQIRGKMDFHVLYRKEEGGLQTLGGMIPFEETVNVPGLEEKDYVSVSWQMEDLDVGIINSRKLSIKAIVTLEIKVETLFDTEAAVEVGTVQDDGADEPLIEKKKSTVSVAAIALRRKDTYRMKEEITLSGSKPAIDRILWTEMRLSGVTTRPMDGRIHVEGMLLVFVVYEGEGENSMIQWLEESIPFSGEVEMSGAIEEMIPAISVRLVHRSIEEKPDYDGEMRELDVDAVMELDIRLYEEQDLEFLSDLYAMNRELEVTAEDAYFDQILMRNTGRCKVAEKINLDDQKRVLQICHSTGCVKLDEATAVDGVLVLDGVLEIRILYMTDDDSQPVQSVGEVIPFHYEAEVPGITPDSIWYLEHGVEQLTAVMVGGEMAEVKAVIVFDILVLQPMRQSVIRSAQIAPLDTGKLQKMPGIVGYLVQKEDDLWKIAKRFHTTVDNIMTTNNLTSETVKPGDCLILVKEVSRG